MDTSIYKPYVFGMWEETHVDTCRTYETWVVTQAQDWLKSHEPAKLCSAPSYHPSKDLLKTNKKSSPKTNIKMYFSVTAFI